MNVEMRSGQQVYSDTVIYIYLRVVTAPFARCCVKWHEHTISYLYRHRKPLITEFVCENTTSALTSASRHTNTPTHSTTRQTP